MARPGEKCAPGSSRWFFRFRFRWQRSIERLTDAEAGRLVKALLYYAITGEAVDLPGKESVLMTMLLDDLDEDVTDAAYTSSTNRQNAMTRWHGTAAPTGCDRMRSDASAYKDEKGKDSNIPPKSPRGGRRKEKSAYTEEDLRRMEANEVDLNGGSDERVEEVHSEGNKEMV